MSKTIRFTVVLATMVLMAGVLSFAQSPGAAVYKAHCQSCHGAAGIPSPGMAKMMGIKSAQDPAMKKLSEAQIKDAVIYFRSLEK